MLMGLRQALVANPSRKCQKIIPSNPLPPGCRELWTGRVLSHRKCFIDKEQPRLSGRCRVTSKSSQKGAAFGVGVKITSRTHTSHV